MMWLGMGSGESRCIGPLQYSQWEELGSIGVAIWNRIQHHRVSRGPTS